MDGDGGDSVVIRGYALKTSKVGTSLFGLAVLLTAFTAICKIALSDMVLISSA
jgi:hypothetical protein